MAPRGRDPSIAGDTVADEEFSIPADGRVRDVSVRGSWVALVSGRGAEGGVWAGSHRDATRYRLATNGTAVAMDGERVVWVAKDGYCSRDHRPPGLAAPVTRTGPSHVAPRVDCSGAPRPAPDLEGTCPSSRPSI